jgi:hypothetical protein
METTVFTKPYLGIFFFHFHQRQDKTFDVENPFFSSREYWLDDEE